MTDPPRRGKSDTGLDQNLAAAIAYALGLVGGILFLLVEKRNRFVRFHAMQSALTFGVVGILFLVVRGLPFGHILSVPFLVGVVALWIVLMIQAINGRMYKLPVIGEWAEGQLK